MLHLSQEILASYTLQDLKEGVKIGTTKTKRLSREEYSALVSIHHIKVILNEMTIQSYQSEKLTLLNLMVKEAQKFASINILPDASKASLEASLKIYNTI